MMGIETLIKRLNQYSQSLIAYKLGADFADACMDAATALSTLQAENEEMQKQLNMFSEFLCYMTGGLLSKTNYTAQEMATAAEDYQQKACGECDLRAENEKLRADVVRFNDLLASYQNVLVPELRVENENLKERIEDTRLEWYAKGFGEVIAEVKRVRAELEQVKRERDVAVEYLRGQCRYCKRNLVCTSRKGPHSNCWEWHGQKED